MELHNTVSQSRLCPTVGETLEAFEVRPIVAEVAARVAGCGDGCRCRLIDDAPGVPDPVEGPAPVEAEPVE